MGRATLTIERYHVRGTPRHIIRAMYCGQDFFNQQAHATIYAKGWDGPEVVKNILEHPGVKACGFTHVKYTGDWGPGYGGLQPKNGLISRQKFTG